MIDRIEVFVTELPTRIQRTFSSGSYDTGAPQDLLGKPVLVAIHSGGAVGYGQIRPISPGHFVADTVHSVVAAITEIYGPLLLGLMVTVEIDEAKRWPQSRAASSTSCSGT